MNVNTLFPTDNIDIYDYLLKMGVQDPQEYLKCRTIEDDFHYANMQAAIDLFNKYLNDEIGVLVDEDVDGFLSASMLVSFIKEKYNKDIQYFIHNENTKAHGISDTDVRKRIKNSNIKLLIIPDASANTKAKMNMDILVLDHHNNKENYCASVVVNNQFSLNVENKAASGTLVTWHFLHALDSTLANSYISYPAISIISDVMSFTTNENRTFLHYGLKEEEIHSNLLPMIQKLQSKKDYSTDEPSTYLDLSVTGFAFGGLIPKTNAVVRVGTKEEKEEIFKLYCGQHENLEKALKIFNHCNNEQTKQKADLEENHVTIDDYNQNILLGKVDIKTSLTGLVAMNLVSKYGKPVLLVHQSDNGECAGSVRSPIDLQTILNKSGEFNYASGHERAFGVSYKLSNEQEVKDYLYSLRLSEPSYDVFTSETVNSLSSALIDRFEPYKALWGNDLKEPTYYIHDIHVKKDDIHVIGRTGTTITFQVGDWKFIKFFCSHEWQDKTFIYDDMTIDLIGTLDYNVYNGTKTKQVTISDMEVKNHEVSFEDLFG